MSDDLETSINSIQDKSKRFLSLDFFGPYSFEYAYRVLLVYLSTQKLSINALRANDPKYFDRFFEDSLRQAILGMAELRGVSLETRLLNKVLRFANDSLVLFLKSPMRDKPTALARDVSQAMDGMVKEALGNGSDRIVPNVFSEDEI